MCRLAAARVGVLAAIVAATGVLPACGVSSDPAADLPEVLTEDVDYDDRLAAVRALAERFPGTVDEDGPLSEVGMWAGIIVQTEWQQRSGRVQVPHWSLVNLGLTAEAAAYGAEWAQGTSPEAACGRSAVVAANPSPPGIEPARVDVCQAWMAYFDASEAGAPRAEQQERFWVAHTTTILQRVLAHRDRFEAVDVVPSEERNFWANWIQVVVLLEAANFPTTGTTSVPASSTLMPPCAPLGDPGCTVDGDSLGSRLAFVRPMAERNTSIDDIVAVHDAVLDRSFAPDGAIGGLLGPDITGTLDRLRGLTDALDPVLASAVGAYLRAAG